MNRPAKIPAILHQTSRTADPPPRWQHVVGATRRLHPGWEHRIWTDESIDRYVEANHPTLAPIFRGFDRGIMRADVIRYVVLHDIGGVYCDLDYEFLRPYDYGDAELVLSLEFDRTYGDSLNQIANYVMASAPGHPFWRDVLDEIVAHPPRVDSYMGVVDATGPGLLTRVYFRNRRRYQGVRLTPRPELSPYRMRGRNERRLLLNSGVTYGFHHASGSWKDRFSVAYFRAKAAKLLGFGPGFRPGARAA